MTIGQSIVDWLMEFGDIEASDAVIETDQLDSDTGSMGLYKQPNKDVRPFVNGSRDVTEYYYLLARQPAKDERSRIAAQAWMEALEAWVRTRNTARDLPTLDGGRECYSIEVSVSAYMSSTDESGRTAEYQISIAIKYMEV